MSLLELEKVRKIRIREDGVRLNILQGISMALPAGSVTVMVGPSGCGKTTLLRLINRLEEPNGGRILLDGYEEDARKEDFHDAIANFRSSERDLLNEAARHVFRYYEDMSRGLDRGDPDYVEAAAPASIWDHVQLGSELHISRRRYGDHAVYISLECNCDWEPEHGLQLVFKEGLAVVKVGPYDGHLTNADAYDDPGLEGTIYKER